MREPNLVPSGRSGYEITVNRQSRDAKELFSEKNPDHTRQLEPSCHTDTPVFTILIGLSNSINLMNFTASITEIYHFFDRTYAKLFFVQFRILFLLIYLTLSNNHFRLLTEGNISERLASTGGFLKYVMFNSLEW